MSRIVALSLGFSVLTGPALAGAQEVPALPGVPDTGEIVPEGTLPPEVEAIVNDSIAQALEALVNLDIPGVAQNEASPGHSSAAAVDIPGVVTVGKAETTTDSSKVTVLSAGGQDLLVREGNAEGGSYTGPLAPAGDVVDSINEALCPGGVDDETQTCVLVLYSRSTSTSSATGFLRSNTASFKALKVQLAGTEEGIEVLPANASTTKIGGSCIDLATAWIGTGTGSAAPLALVGLGNAISFASGPC